jgi:methanethiol S-methyltransferase
MRPRLTPLAAVVAWSGAVVFVGTLGFTLWSYLYRFGAADSGTPWLRPLGSDIALFTLFGLHHSLLARSGIKRHVVARVGPALERPLYVWVASLLLIACCAWWQPLPGRVWTWPSSLTVVPLLLQALGGLVTALAARRLDALELAGIRPPSPEAPLRPLETRGLYGLVRHPIYFGWILLVFGAPDMTWTRGVFALVSVLYLLAAVPLEERGLLSVYGDAYRSYMRRVRWRLVPGLY